MANLIDLKKEVRYACGELAAECMIAAHYVEGVDPKAMSEIVGKIASLQGSALSHVSFSFDKTQKNFENRAAISKPVRSISRRLMPLSERNSMKRLLRLCAT